MRTENTTAVIVTFNADMELLGQLLSSLETQCHAVVIDNGSLQDSLRDLKQMVGGHDNTELLCLPENTGIANAQNVAINHAISRNRAIRHILLLDHDSVPGDLLVVTLEEVFRELSHQNIRVAAIGPVLYDPRDDKQLDFHKIKYGWWGKIRPASMHNDTSVIEVDSLNSSGTLLSVEAFRHVGEFDSGLFIDHVETEWCFRAKSMGYRIYATTRSELTHHMGDNVCHYWLLGKKRMPYRSPLRHYYIARNSILLQKRKHVPLAWKFPNLLKMIFTFAYFGLYYKDSSEQRRQILLGLGDGLKGITGASSH